MSRVCQVTGAEPGFGHLIFHSHVRTKRRFDVNVQRKRWAEASTPRTTSAHLEAAARELSRVRDMAHRGELPGVTTSSW